MKEVAGMGELRERRKPWKLGEAAGAAGSGSRLGREDVRMLSSVPVLEDGDGGGDADPVAELRRIERMSRELALRGFV